MNHNSPLAAVRAELSRHLKAAVKARDQVSTSALRAALGALDHAGAPPLARAQPTPYGSSAEVARSEVTGTDIKALLLGEAEEHSAAAAEYERLGHSERADRLRREAEIIRGSLEHLAAVDPTDGP